MEVHFKVWHDHATIAGKSRSDLMTGLKMDGTIIWLCGLWW